MKKNMGIADKVIRVVAAIVIGALLMNGSLTGILGTILGIFAIVFLLTGAVGSCPLYMPFKLSTKKAASQQASSSTMR